MQRILTRNEAEKAAKKMISIPDEYINKFNNAVIDALANQHKGFIFSGKIR